MGEVEEEEVEEIFLQEEEEAVAVVPWRHFVEVEVLVEEVMTQCNQEEAVVEAGYTYYLEEEVVVEVGRPYYLEEVVVGEVGHPYYLEEEVVEVGHSYFQEEEEEVVLSLWCLCQVEVVEGEPKSLHTQNQVEEEMEEVVEVERLPCHHLAEVEEAAWRGRDRQTEAETESEQTVVKERVKLERNRVELRHLNPLRQEQMAEEQRYPKKTS